MRHLVLFATLLLAACAAVPERPPIRDPDPTRARAALATLVVDNRYSESITISYRHAGRDGPAVGIGSVQPRAVLQMAPVPAGEPIVLVARNAAGLELVLPPRTFPIDGLWTWLVPANARFGRTGDAAAHP